MVSRLTGTLLHQSLPPIRASRPKMLHSPRVVVASATSLSRSAFKEQLKQKPQFGLFLDR